MKFSRNCLKIQHAFTLIELLTVIAIVLILASLLFPATIRIQQSAKRVNCINKHRNIGMLNTQFAGRNNGTAAIDTNVALLLDNQKVFYEDGSSVMESVLTSVSASAWGRILVDQGAIKKENFFNLQIANAVGDASMENLGVNTEEGWMFVCDNTLPLWCGVGNEDHIDANWRYYDWNCMDLKKPKLNYYMMNWGTIGTRRFYTGKYSWQGMVYTYFYDEKGPYGQGPYFSVLNSQGKPAGASTEERLPMATIARPSSRVYASEIGLKIAESTYDKNMVFPSEKTQIGTRSGYIPGYYGGTKGKAKLEKYGYDNFITESKYYDKIKNDVEEGRHDGYTLHLFFDGHVEQISADRIGDSQLEGNNVAPITDKLTLNGNKRQCDEFYGEDNKPLKGLYASPSYAGE